MESNSSEVAGITTEWGRKAWRLLAEVRCQSPLIQCITNFVSMDLMANALLSAGASPAMLHSIEEIPDFTPHAHALCINVGTLSPAWLPAMKAATALASKLGRPWVLDPVAAAASGFRLKACLELVEMKPTVIRGNGSEIIALSKASSEPTKSKPKVAFWRNTPFSHYEKMVILYGNDRATGQDAETSSEMRKKHPSATEEYFTENIDNVDNLVSQNEVTLENTDSFHDVTNDNMNNSSAQVPSHGATSGSNKKKKKEKDNEINEIKGAVGEIADVLREGNVILKETQQHKLPPISGEETWKLIQECGCDTTLLPRIYIFLMKNIDKLRTIVQCPAAARKLVIMEWMFGPSSNSPSN